jgi:diguanylate cyclase (GGDEF)-like protein
MPTRHLADPTRGFSRLPRRPQTVLAASVSVVVAMLVASLCVAFDARDIAREAAFAVSRTALLALEHRASRTAALVLVCATVFFGLAGYLARLISQRDRLVAMLQQLARLDALTKLDNRRSFDERLMIEWRRAVRSKRPLSVLFIDIDHFKEYNDSYGHQAGDAALTAVARCIGAKLRRPADFAARYGGEEFVVVLPDTDEDGAHVVAQTLRRAVSALDITDVAGGRRVTVSIGAATWTAHAAREASAILKAADEALYLAKAAGRNTVFTAQLA